MNPELGFLPRRGIRQISGGVAYKPRPSGDEIFKWVRQFHFEIYATRVDNLDKYLETWDIFISPLNLITQSGEHFEFFIEPHYERLVESFEIATGVIIPEGKYRFSRYGIELESSDSRPWQIGTEIGFGEFYGGDLATVMTFLSWTGWNGHLQLELENVNDFGDLPGGSFAMRLWQLQASYAFSPDLIFSSYAQYDNESGEIGMNNRLRWSIRPGCDLYLVWNHGWVQQPGQSLLQSQSESDQIAIKLRWTLRM